jgi:hypothetical protein
MENSSLKIQGAAAKRGRLKSGEDWRAGFKRSCYGPTFEQSSYSGFSQGK